MKRATLTAATVTAVEALLNSLDTYEMATIETTYGTITVQRIYNGAEAWLTSSVVPGKEIGVRCVTCLDAFIHQYEVGKRYAAEIETAAQADEAAIEAEIVAQMTPLAYSLIFSAALKFSARLPLLSILSANFDKTLFATNTGGTLNVQTFYYPADSDCIFGSCDCLRFRNTSAVCEHLAAVACEELFVSTFGNAEVAA